MGKLSSVLFRFSPFLKKIYANLLSQFFFWLKSIKLKQITIINFLASKLYQTNTFYTIKYKFYIFKFSKSKKEKKEKDCLNFNGIIFTLVCFTISGETFTPKL